MRLQASPFHDGVRVDIRAFRHPRITGGTDHELGRGHHGFSGERD